MVIAVYLFFGYGQFSEDIFTGVWKLWIWQGCPFWLVTISQGFRQSQCYYLWHKQTGIHGDKKEQTIDCYVFILFLSCGGEGDVPRYEVGLHCASLLLQLNPLVSGLEKSCCGPSVKSTFPAKAADQAHSGKMHVCSVPISQQLPEQNA